MRRRALAVILAVVALLSAGSTRAGTPYEYQPYVGPFVTVSLGGELGGVHRRVEPLVERLPAPAPRRPARLIQSRVYRTEGGTASWGDFGGHVVTRLPRGTHITVIGPRGRWSGASWGYGPQSRTGRLVDLDRSVFASICGAPSMGLCRVTLEY